MMILSLSSCLPLWRHSCFVLLGIGGPPLQKHSGLCLPDPEAWRTTGVSNLNPYVVLLWFPLLQMNHPTSSLTLSSLQLLQRDSSQAGPCLLGRGHCLRHLWGGGQTTQQCVEDPAVGPHDGRGPEGSTDQCLMLRTTQHLYSSSF